MAGGGGGERTEQATPKRRQDERKKGNVFKSQEIVILAGLMAVVYTLRFLGGWLLSSLTHNFDLFFSQAASQHTLHASDLGATLVQGLLSFAVCALPPLLAAGLAAVIVTLAQTRGLVSFKQVAPKGNRLSPMKGIKKIFSARGAVELIKSIVKIIVLGYVIYSQYVEKLAELPRLMEMEFFDVLFYCAGFILDLITAVAVIYAFLAAADYMFQRWQYEKDLRMSKQEIKEEYKQTEGDPQIKGQIRQKQRQMAQSRMMQNVPQADVVVRNPTHYAVAMRYEAKGGAAPVVVAKGADLLALRIVHLAEDSGVAVVENRALARGLYEGVPLDAEIPERFFQPVAEVLAFVYSTGKKMRDKLPKKL